MNKISATIVTLDEERNIERCLKSVQWADEIVVVDSGSTDRTLDICRDYDCRIIETEWLGYARTKQLAVDAAANDWIFSIDADEEATPELGAKIMEITKSQGPVKGFRINRRSFYLGKKIRHSGWRKDFPLRLFHRNFGRFNLKPVHEGVEVNGDVGRLQEVLYHYTFPTLATHVRKIELYSELGAAEKKERGAKAGVPGAFFRGGYEFFRIYFLKAGFLDGRRGLILACNSAFAAYMKYLLLWEMVEQPNKLY